jgi:hypothetical protein
MIYACSTKEYVADLSKLQHLKIKVLRTVGKFQRCKPVHELPMGFQVLYIIMLQKCAGNKQKSYKIMKIQMFATSEKAKPVTENMGGFILAAVKHMTIQVSKQPL